MSDEVLICDGKVVLEALVFSNEFSHVYRAHDSDTQIPYLVKHYQSADRDAPGVAVEMGIFRDVRSPMIPQILLTEDTGKDLYVVLESPVDGCPVRFITDLSETVAHNIICDVNALMGCLHSNNRVQKRWNRRSMIYDTTGEKQTQFLDFAQCEMIDAANEGQQKMREAERAVRLVDKVAPWAVVGANLPEALCTQEASRILEIREALGCNLVAAPVLRRTSSLGQDLYGWEQDLPPLTPTAL